MAENEKYASLRANKNTKNPHPTENFHVWSHQYPKDLKHPLIHILKGKKLLSLLYETL